MKLPCEVLSRRITTPVLKVCATVSWSNTGPSIQDPCGLNSIINGISSLQADYHLTPAREEENGLAWRPRELSTKLKFYFRHARLFLGNGNTSLHFVCYKRRPTTSGVVSWHAVQEAPRSGSVDKKPLLVEAVGSFEELLAYIIPLAFQRMPPMPWRAWRTP